MAIKNLTVKEIDAAQPGAHVIRLRDGAVPGLHIVITPKGTKSWALAFTSPVTGKRRFYPLGSFTDDKKLESDRCLTLRSARVRATQLRALIDNEGIDPIEKDREDAEAARKAEIAAETGTVAQLIDLYIKNLELDGKDRSAKQIRSAIDYNCQDIMAMKARDVGKDDITNIKSRIAERGSPVQANRVRTYLHAAFEFGINYMGEDRWYRKFKSGEIPDFQLTHNPVSRVRRNKAVEQPRKRFLDEDEIALLWESLTPDRFDSELTLAIKLLLATGQRVEEVLQARWSEFNEKIWRIPAERRKTRRSNPVDHLVPLTDFHLQLLEELKQYTGESPFLFPHRDGDRPRTSDSLSQALRRFCDPQLESKHSTRAKFPAFIPKDCRRTFKTMTGSIGLSLEIRNRLQGHAFQDVGSKNYDEWGYLPEKTEAMEQWTRWLEQLVTGQSAKVVQIKGASNAG